MSLMKADSDTPGWRKSRRSMANGNCVEVRPANGGIAVRDSKNPSGYMLAYSAPSWRAFTLAAQQGHYDAHLQ
jgi:Domain of unknown function (DUF397)